MQALLCEHEIFLLPQQEQDRWVSKAATNQVMRMQLHSLMPSEKACCRKQMRKAEKATEHWNLGLVRIILVIHEATDHFLLVWRSSKLIRNEGSGDEMASDSPLSPRFEEKVCTQFNACQPQLEVFTGWSLTEITALDLTGGIRLKRGSRMERLHFPRHFESRHKSHVICTVTLVLLVVFVGLSSKKCSWFVVYLHDH